MKKKLAPSFPPIHLQSLGFLIYPETCISQKSNYTYPKTKYLPEPTRETRGISKTLTLCLPPFHSGQISGFQHFTPWQKQFKVYSTTVPTQFP